MEPSLQEMYEIQADAGYAHFIHTNLHMHTPATPKDWDDFSGQTRRADTISPEVYFDTLNATSLELVAITDHNCVKWCDPLVKLAKSRRQNRTSRLHILPGVEITTYEGPHLLAIFDEEQNPSVIRDMLVRLGMSGDGDPEDKVGARSTKAATIHDVVSEITDLHGLVIAPHVHTADGLWGNKSFRSRIDVLNDPRIRILAAPSEHIKRVVEGRTVRLLDKHMPSDQITNSYAFINVSDCHRLDDFELNTTWMKMGTPSLNGVKQIIYEPELRLSHEIVDGDKKHEFSTPLRFRDPIHDTHPYLIGIAVTGGMLDGQKIGFSSNLNCIIGRNYAGKSAVLDCLRFALDVLPEDDKLRSKYAERLRAILGEGSEVRLYFRGKDGQHYALYRTLTCDEKKRNDWRIEGNTTVYSLWNNAFHLDGDLTVKQVIQAEVYPQGEVVRIKDNAERQMAIVDSLVDVETQLESLSVLETRLGDLTVKGQLVDNSKRIVETRTTISELTDETAEIDALTQEVKELTKLMDSPLLSEAKLWMDVESTLGNIVVELRTLSRAWNVGALDYRYTPLQDSSFELIADDASTLEEEMNEVDWVLAGEVPTEPDEFWPSEQDITFDLLASYEYEEEESPTNIEDQFGDSEYDFYIFNSKVASPDEYFMETDRIVSSLSVVLTECTSLAREHIKAASVVIDKLKRCATERYAALKNMFSSQMSIPDKDAKAALIQRIASKKKKLSELESKKHQLVELNAAIEEFSKDRQRLLDTYYRTWIAVRQARLKVVKIIDENSAENIGAELLESSDTSDYIKTLIEIVDELSNSATHISNKQVQIELLAANILPAELIEITNEGDISKLIKLAPRVTQNTARIIMSMTESHKHQLELCLLRDEFVVRYRKEGEESFTPIDGGLSGGEQALALMSVAMVPKGMPLIIDQPEDELGPALITNELVEQIRAMKSCRQLIFVTHVPNIPVLADSEQIICIRQEIGKQKRSVVKHRGSLDNPGIVQSLLELDGGEKAFAKRRERYALVTGAVK